MGITYVNINPWFLLKFTQFLHETCLGTVETCPWSHL